MKKRYIVTIIVVLVLALGFITTKLLLAKACFLQVLFPESCKIFFHSIATGISTMLQSKRKIYHHIV